jgi:hypothetical protein
LTRTQLSPTRRLLRNLALILGGIMLLWLPLEDVHENWVILFALALCALAAAWFLAPFPAWSGKGRLAYPLAGLLAGLAVTPAALFLMAFKTGIHGHSAPDFTPDQVTSVLLRTPVWVLAGLLLGLSISILKRDR